MWISNELRKQESQLNFIMKDGYRPVCNNKLMALNTILIRIIFLNRESRKKLIILENNHGRPYFAGKLVMTLNCQFGRCQLERKSKLICHCPHCTYWTWHNAGLQQPNLCDLWTVEGNQICNCASVAHSCLLWMERRRQMLRIVTQKARNSMARQVEETVTGGDNSNKRCLSNTSS